MATDKTLPGNSENRCHFKILNRGKGQVLCHSGHQYYIKRKNKSGEIVWECILRRKSHCSGALTIKDKTLYKESPHNHSPDFAKNEVDEVLHKCKETITADPGQAIPAVYNNAIVDLEDAGLNLIEKIPALNSIKSTLYRSRNNAAGVSKLLHNNVSDVEIPAKFGSFLMADYNYDNNRIIVFCSNNIKNLICDIKNFFGDGTFKSCSPPFEQLYTIHGDLDKGPGTNIVPLFYALMSNRTQNSYSILFQVIQSQCPEFNPITFKTDYEKATMAAIADNFPNAEIKGCYYHYRKALWKKAKSLKLTKSKVLRRQVALSAVLPLLPEDEIVNGWFYVAHESPNDENSKKFRQYMLKYWMKDDFYKKWCAFGLSHRTTNFLEGWHFRLNTTVGKKNPNLYRLIDILKKDACFYSAKAKRIQSGVITTYKRALKSMVNDEFIQDCQMQLINGTITVGHFLEKVK